MTGAIFSTLNVIFCSLFLIIHLGQQSFERSKIWSSRVDHLPGTDSANFTLVETLENLFSKSLMLRQNKLERLVTLSSQA
jgi:hypothetical protein